MASLSSSSGMVGDAPQDYKRVVVIGSQKCGKTTLIHQIINNDFTDYLDYTPTKGTKHFYDSEHLIEFVDTPGFPDDLIDGSKWKEPFNRDLHEENYDSMERKYLDFRKDRMVEELLDEKGAIGTERKQKLSIDVEYSSVDAWLIVFANSEESKRTAKALRHTLLHRNGRIQTQRIYILANVYDDKGSSGRSISRRDPNANVPPGKVYPEIDLRYIFTSSHQITGERYRYPRNQAKGTRSTFPLHQLEKQVNAASGANVEWLLHQLRTDMFNLRDTKDGQLGTRSRNICSVGDTTCIIS